MSGYLSEAGPTPSRPEPIHLNVCTLALPRLLVGRCVKSFLDCVEDREQYRLNWICLLDKSQGLETQYEETLSEIRDIELSFERFDVFLPEYEQGFGKAVNSLLCKAIQHDILWIPDDWLWTKPFRLTDALDVTEDWFTFVGGTIRPGTTHPTFWRRHVINELLHKLQGKFLYDLHEQTISNVLEGKLEATQHPQITGKVCRHLGDEENR